MRGFCRNQLLRRKSVVHHGKPHTISLRQTFIAAVVGGREDEMEMES
ncbi:hypothetical protein L195_g031365 [Trifolium pratense]|uniref:Uncharacterized protein n=1 Tax=Trifolium pratense TaxID=57577 RepID=A0A2K3LA66_TRIPR|nr:hypothetical protein L195_g031365 [Trifolium pratense]